MPSSTRRLCNPSQRRACRQPILCTQSRFLSLRNSLYHGPSSCRLMPNGLPALRMPRGQQMILVFTYIVFSLYAFSSSSTGLFSFLSHPASTFGGDSMTSRALFFEVRAPAFHSNPEACRYIPGLAASLGTTSLPLAFSSLQPHSPIRSTSFSHSVNLIALFAQNHFASRTVESESIVDLNRLTHTRASPRPDSFS